MRRLAWAESLVGEEAADPKNWPAVDTEHLAPNELRKFQRRKRAVQLHLQSDVPIAQICEKAGLCRSEVRRLVKRCLEVGADGRVWGWYALLPHVRLKPYRAKKATGRAGSFACFLEDHPELEKKLEGWALARKPADGTKPHGKVFSEIWLSFRRACEEAGIDVKQDYPFTNRDQGREAVRRHCRKVRKLNFTSGAVAEFGTGTIRAGSCTHPVWDDAQPLEGPYHRVQFDGHRMDVDLVVEVEDADGKLIPLPLSRLWLLIVIDVASRAVLGYHISLEENYTTDDVLECIASTAVPWTPKELPNDRVAYSHGAGLPSGVIDECAWRAFNVIQFDNAWAHTSKWVKERIMRTERCEVITNRPRRPRSNQIVERFNNTFEQTTLHRWPSTTGSSPKDARRKNPEKEAKKLRAGFDDLLVAADLAIANYNAAPHAGLSGLSPLEFLAQRIERRYDLIRHIEARDPESLTLFEKSFTATMRGNPKLAHYPYVQFMGVRYSSDVLASSPELIGERVQFRVNVKDIRTAEVFHKGRSLGRVYADAKWMRHPHSLRIRRAILKLIKKRRIDWSAQNPVGAHLEYLRERQRRSRRDRNKFARAKRDAQLQSLPSQDIARPGRRQPWSSNDRIRIDSTHVTG